MRLLLLISFLILATNCLAAPTLEDYGNLPEIQKMAVSPSGKLVAFRKVTAEQDLLMVYSIAENKLINAADISAAKPRGISFANDDFVLLTASEYKGVYGFRGKFEVSTIFSFNVKTSQIAQILLPGDGVVWPGQSGLGNLVGISKDGNFLYLPAYIGKAGLSTFSVEPKFGLLKARTDGSDKPEVMKGASNYAVDFFVGEDGEIIAREEFDDKRNVHKLRVREGDVFKESFVQETEIIDRNFVGLSFDEKSLVILDTDENNGRTALYTMNLQDGTVSEAQYNRDDADIGGVILDDQRRVQGVVYSGFKPSYKFFDEKVQNRVNELQEIFAADSLYINSFSPDWKHILIMVEGSGSPGDYYLASEGKDPLYIATQRPNIAAEDIHPFGTVTFTARDGYKIPTLITIPNTKLENMKNLPAVVMPHGGPASYDTIGFDFMAQAFAQQGYLVIMPQFRGSAGFGLAHQNAGHGEWGRKMQDDVSDAVNFFAGKGMIDPKHVCIVGGSYGGYAALAGGAFTPELYRCVVSLNGVADLPEFYTWIRDRAGRNSQTLSYWRQQMGDEDYSKDEARARSPEHFAENFQAPVLLIHSKNDSRVPIEQSEEMERALKKAKKSVQFVELEGDDHHLSFGETRLKALNAMMEFVNKNI